MEKHLENIAKFHLPCVVAVNRFPTDSDDEIAVVKEAARAAERIRDAFAQDAATGVPKTQPPPVGGQMGARNSPTSLNAFRQISQFWDGRAATVEEFSLIRHFAAQAGFQDVPELAYALVSPLVERHDATPARLTRRLRYNPEYLSARVSNEDLELAVLVFENGGYRYRDRELTLQGAREYLELGSVPK